MGCSIKHEPMVDGRWGIVVMLTQTIGVCILLLAILFGSMNITLRCAGSGGGQNAGHAAAAVAPDAGVQCSCGGGGGDDWLLPFAAGFLLGGR